MSSVILYHHKEKNYMVIFMTFFQLHMFYETKLASILNYQHDYEILYISLIVTTSTTS